MSMRKLPWRWLQFRLSTLLMFVVVVALATGWWSEHRRLSVGIRERDNLIVVLRMARDLRTPGVFSAHLDIPVASGSFALAAPPAFGGPESAETTVAHVLSWVHDGEQDEAFIWRIPRGEAQPAVADMLVLLGHSKAVVRSRALVALGHVGAANAMVVDAIALRLNDEDADCRRVAAIALTKIAPSEQVLARLLGAFAREQDTYVRECLAIAASDVDASISVRKGQEIRNLQP